MTRQAKDEAREERIHLEGIQVDEETQQALEDWHYWVNRGYEL